MVIDIRGRVFKGGHLWFESFNDYEEIKQRYKKSYDFLVIRGNPYKIDNKFCICEKQYSLITDLEIGIETVYKQFSKTYRNEISRAERELVNCVVYESKDIIENTYIRNDFSKTYHNMYSQKGMNEIFWNEKEIITYAQQDRIIFSVAYIEELPVVFHSYIIGDGKVRLFHSCSEFRSGDKIFSNAVGRANKKLHWEDLVYFFKKGIKYYDWGGISSYNNPNGIDDFKIRFGGEEVEYYNIFVNLSKIYAGFDKIKKIIKKN